MKKSIFTIFTLLFVSAFANAQITIMPYFQGDLTHYATFANNNNRTLAQELRKASQPIFNYNTGVYMNYNLSEKWSLKSGVIFQKMGERITYTKEDYPFLNNKVSSTFHHNFINIPLQVQYNFNATKKFSPYIAFGSSLLWNTNYYYVVRSFYEEEVINKSEKLLLNNSRKFNFSFKTDIGFQYRLTDKFNLNTFFSGNFLVLSTLDNVLKPHHFNIGLGIGLGYTI